MPWTAPPTFTPGQVVTATDLNTYLRDNPSYLVARPGQSIKRDNGAAYTTTSDVMTDIDGTNLSITLVMAGSAVLVSFSAMINQSGTPQVPRFDFTIDGVLWSAATRGILFHLENSQYWDIGYSYTVLVTGLTPGTHVFKPQWRRNAASGTCSLAAQASSSLLLFSVQEVA